MKYSIVIPVYNEAESIPELIDRVSEACRRLGRFEIICVDDGSTDGSFSRLTEAGARVPELKIISFAANAGKSDALDAGFRAATGEVIITLDADLQNPPEEIPRFIEALDGVDAVFGR
ncbi:MAG: glycosyltransferase, partial [Deltaproteobacteria bacterium]|nr:glycosyltransferase [Deltaproteobacteria bacterium]